jgi:5-methyltetrahydrofolate--homocysteine methyltransferase
MKGVENFLEADLNEMMASDSDAPVSAVSIIEGPLMAGMHRVGELFGEGKMFLPQVVRTARTMKKAVAYLQPYIGLPDGDGTSMAGTVLLATVKGDVHDIGKNIVSVVMACNGYRIVDLGVMTPAERIVEEAKTLRPDVIGLSGLITPSLEEMAHVLRELKREGIAIPVMIGGATTNERHTALKLAPLYDGPVIWVKDASQNAMLAARFLHAETRQTACEELRGAQDALRREWNGKVPSLATIEEARKKRASFFD